MAERMNGFQMNSVIRKLTGIQTKIFLQSAGKEREGKGREEILRVGGR